MDLLQESNLISFGSNENCTLALCPVETSLYGYRPSLGANIAFIALFSVSLLVHVIQGLYYRTWFFMWAMALGCITEIIGYVGRVLLWQNPFSFDGFLIQIICITIGPVFICAGIYVTLTKLVNYLEPSVSWFPPKLYYWVFIPSDLVSLVLQAAGGALSATSTGSDSPGVKISLAGLSIQVITLTFFIGLCIDYAIRYIKFRKAQPIKKELPFRFKNFVFFLSLAIILILVRCAYRIDELSQGYSGPLIHNQGLFIALESALMSAALFALNIGHPGPAFQREMALEMKKKNMGMDMAKSTSDSSGFTEAA